MATRTRRVSNSTGKNFTFIDLFAGCGGMSLGLEQAGFRPLLTCELNDDARATYMANRPEVPEYFKEVADISTITKKKCKELKGFLKEWKASGIAEVDLVAGGPPCQGFSGIGHRRNHSVDRDKIPSNFLFKQMVQVIKTVRPRMFLFENVKGIRTASWNGNGTSVWDHVLAEFRGIKDYDVEPALLHAKHYGVPQNRPRVFIVGIRKDLGWQPDDETLPARGLLPCPVTTAEKGNWVNVGDLLGDLVDRNWDEAHITAAYLNDAKSGLQRKARKKGLKARACFKKGESLQEQVYTRHSKRVKDKFKYMLGHKGKIRESDQTKKFAQRVLPKKWDEETGPTITVTSLPDDYVHPTQPRILTVREWARLQGFPDWYRFCGKRTTGGLRRAGNPREGIFEREVPKYTQIGNAVPVNLACELGKHFKKLLG